MEQKKINIRPTTGVYATYKNLRYEPWTALAEFIDNSTQSYFDHKSELRGLENFKTLKIEIAYETNSDGQDVLTIKDNAFGMESDDFFRAIVLDKPPAITTGRNEFGMGLKTAACWFGRFWTVVSTRYNSEYEYSASVNVEELSKTKEDSIDQDINEVSKELHYTIIEIRELNKRIVGARTKSKVKEFLSSIYRQDIRNKEVEIYYNGELLGFQDPEIFVDESDKQWKQEIEFTINHKGEELEVKGFIAIRKKASVASAGLTLLRRGRVIIGGAEENYRPKELFGDSNSFAYQRIFGELHMDNWPVTQAKDNFDWNDEALEEKFIEKLKPLIKPIKEKADSIRVRKSVNQKQVVVDAIEDLKSFGIIDDSSIKFTDIPASMSASFEEGEDRLVSIKNGDTSIILHEKAISHISITRGNNKYSLELEYNDSISQWLNISETLAVEGETVYNVKLNMTHPFFSKLTSNKDYLDMMTRFVLCLVIAEVEARLIATPDGKVEVGTIRLKMNKLLEEYCNYNKE
ncbi:MAG: ATP-binding protein [Clostridia bacterium]|nr:ATP-binding protein [Clostridia bacterium]